MPILPALAWGVVAIALSSLVIGYNRLVSLQQEVRGAWAQIDVQLKRRHDLIPNLVEAVKGYLVHERQTLERVISARTQAINAAGLPAKAEAENVLTHTLRTLFAVVERYPELKANQNVLALQEELISTENRIAFARQFYNDQVARLNTAVGSVPTNLIASVAGVRPADFFQLDDPGERAAPAVTL